MMNWPMYKFEKLSLFLFPVFATGGIHFGQISVGGLHLFGFRLLILANFVWLLTRLHVVSIQKSYVSLVFIGSSAIGLAWALVSLLWAPDILAAAKEIMAIVLGLTLCGLILEIDNKVDNGEKLLTNGWLFALLISVIIAIWELATKQHLPSVTFESAPDYVKDGNWISGTLGNPNNFAAFIVLAFPFVLAKLKSYRSIRGGLAAVVLAAGLIALVLITKSRLGLLALFAQILVYLFYHFRFGLKTLLLMGTIAVLGLVFIGAPVMHSSGIANRVQSKFSDASTSVRKNLFYDGLYITENTEGLGAGPAAFSALAKAGKLPKFTEHIVNPHNFAMEIVSQYGLIVFVALVLFMGLVLLITLVPVNESFEISLIQQNSITLLAGYLLVSASNSTFINSNINWMAIGSILLMTNRLESFYFRKEPS